MSARILVAGIGNIFLGDDAFGVEVVRRLSRRPLPDGVRVMDVGIRGVHLAYELLAPPQLLVLVDAVPRGQAPGTLYVIEPDTEGQGAADAHSLSLPSVFASVRAMGGTLPKTRLVGCEPADVSERDGLSEAVERALEPAVALVHSLLDAEIGGTATEPGREQDDGGHQV